MLIRSSFEIAPLQFSSLPTSGTDVAVAKNGVSNAER